eukprot:COSAG01_NODE_14604_length_1433_cov_7.603448_1_plen_64_part_00
MSCAAVPEAATTRIPTTWQELGLRLAQAGWWVLLTSLWAAPQLGGDDSDGDGDGWAKTATVAC